MLTKNAAAAMAIVARVSARDHTPTVDQSFEPWRRRFTRA